MPCWVMLGTAWLVLVVVGALVCGGGDALLGHVGHGLVGVGCRRCVGLRWWGCLAGSCWARLGWCWLSSVRWFAVVGMPCWVMLGTAWLVLVVVGALVCCWLLKLAAWLITSCLRSCDWSPFVFIIC